MYRFPWYLTLVSTNHASSNPGQDATRRARPTVFQSSVIALQYDSILPHTNTIILQVSYCGTITEAGSRVLSPRTDTRLRVVY